VPKFLQFFHGEKIVYIAAGSFHSLAITEDGDIYSWGEARQGALGTGTHREVRMPTKVCVEGEPDIRFKQCAAGYGHSAAITTDGRLFVWGFNVYGQAGCPSKKTVWLPRQVTQDSEGYALDTCVKVACSKSEPSL
jgi:alpha-tubulin suppressor-like RCC1 family protein